MNRSEMQQRALRVAHATGSKVLLDEPLAPHLSMRVGGEVAALLVPPLVFAALQLPADAAGLMFGINLGYLIVGRRGFPEDAGSWWRRAARASLALVLVAVTGVAARWLATTVGAPRGTLAIDFVIGLPPGVALIWGTTSLAFRTGLYGGRRRERETGPSLPA